MQGMRVGGYGLLKESVKQRATRAVLDPKSIEEMRTVQAPRVGAPASYALGVARHRWNLWDQRPDLLEHGGCGDGFLSDLWWLPQLGIGVAILTSSGDQQLWNDLALSILANLVTEPGVYRDRLLAIAAAGRRSGPVVRAPGRPLHRTDSSWTPASLTSRPTTPRRGARSPPPRQGRARPVPCRQRRDARPPGTGADLANPPARARLAPAPWQWAILGTAAILAAAWLVAAGVRTVRRQRSR
jgi:hypothetical protein